MVFLYYRIFSEIRRRAKKPTGQPSSARKQQPLSQIPATTSVSDQAFIQRHPPTQLQLHSKQSIRTTAELNGNGQGPTTLSSSDRAAANDIEADGRKTKSIGKEPTSPRIDRSSSSLRHRFSAIPSRTDSASSNSAEPSNSSTEDAYPPMVAPATPSNSLNMTVNKSALITNNVAHQTSVTMSSISTKPHSTSSFAGMMEPRARSSTPSGGGTTSEDVDSALVIENRQADVDFSLNNEAAMETTEPSMPSVTASVATGSIEPMPGSRKRLLGRFARSAKMQDKSEMKRTATISHSNDLEMSPSPLSGRMMTKPVVGCDLEVIENRSAFEWKRLGRGGICVDCGGVCDHKLASVAPARPPEPVADRDASACVIDILADFSHDHEDEEDENGTCRTDHVCSTGNLIAETRFTCEIIANRSTTLTSLASEPTSVSGRCVCDHTPFIKRPEKLGLDPSASPLGETSALDRTTRSIAKSVTISEEQSAEITYLSAANDQFRNAAAISVERSEHCVGVDSSDVTITTTNVTSTTTVNGVGTINLDTDRLVRSNHHHLDLNTATVMSMPKPSTVSSACTEISSSGANSSSGGGGAGVGAPETETGDHGRLVVPSGLTSGRHLSVANLAASSSTSGRTDASLLGKKKSRFNLGRKQKSSRKKREKASAKRERKATKTLAIVLGTIFFLLFLAHPLHQLESFSLFTLSGLISFENTFLFRIHRSI